MANIARGKTWKLSEVETIYHRPLLNLIVDAAVVHRRHNNHRDVQISQLISIKTGGCREDCSYCSQAARYHTDVTPHPMMSLEEVTKKALVAKSRGASRFCMGASWREVRDNRDFDRVLAMVSAVNELGMEVCCTLGMITYEQALKLKEAGCFSYNHNLDTSSDYYGHVITTRTYQNRLDSLENARKASLSVCSGGIIGLGETQLDRVKMLHRLATLNPPPDSVPINALVPVKGTPLEDAKPVPIYDMVRTIATARIVMPKSRVRLSAGRNKMTVAEQALCFLAGANSIFVGEKLLTTPNPDFDEDMHMLDMLGLVPYKSNKGAASDAVLSRS